jgi:UDP-N-acetylmuramoylalanine-D-glutamate ligase
MKKSEKNYFEGAPFTPCTVFHSLVEPIPETERFSVSGKVVLVSPACSSSDQFRKYQKTGEILCPGMESIGRGAF